MASKHYSVLSNQYSDKAASEVHRLGITVYVLSSHNKRLVKVS